MWADQKGHIYATTCSGDGVENGWRLRRRNVIKRPAKNPRTSHRCVHVYGELLGYALLFETLNFDIGHALERARDASYLTYSSAADASPHAKEALRHSNAALPYVHLPTSMSAHPTNVSR